MEKSAQMKKTLIFILVSNDKKNSDQDKPILSRKAITEQLQKATETDIISRDFAPSIEEEQDRVSRGDVPWDKLSDDERQRKGHVIAIRNILTVKKEQFIVDRPTLSNEEVFIYKYLSSECTIATVRILDSLIRRDLNRGLIVFINNEETEHFRQQLKKGNPGAYLLNKEQLNEVESHINADPALKDLSSEDLEEVRILRRDESFQDELTKGTSLIIIDQSILDPQSVDLYKYLGKVKRYAYVTVSITKFDPQLLEMKFSNTEDFNKPPSNAIKQSIEWKKYIPKSWNSLKWNKKATA